MTKAVEQKETKKRVERTPIAAQSVLNSEARAGYHRRYVNDYAGRIDMFLKAGYAFVKHDTDESTGQVQDPSVMDSSCIRKVVNKTLQEGMGRYAYLMEIPQEWWEEDQQLKDSKTIELENEIDPTQSTKAYTYGGVFKNG
jgi:hypothetical protein